MQKKVPSWICSSISNNNYNPFHVHDRVPINFCKVIRENFGQNWGKITQHLVSTRPKKDFKTVCNEPPLASVMTQI